MPDTPPGQDTIDHLITAVYPSFAMLAGMQLNLFSVLKDGAAMGPEQIGRALEVRGDKLKPLLYALVAAGLLTVEGDLFSNTPESEHYLVEGSPAYLGHRHEHLAWQWNAVLRTADSIRLGAPQSKLDFTSTDETLESFYRGQYSMSLARGRLLASRYDFSPYRSLLDIGGGTGGLSIALTEVFPHLEATVADLPTVTDITRRYLSDAKAADRIQVMDCDIVNERPAGSFNVAVVSSLIQVLAADQAARALQNVGQAIEPGGGIFVRGSILDDTCVTPSKVVVGNLIYLNVYDAGQAYTEREYTDWLSAAGFEEISRVVLPDGDSIMTGRRA